MGLSPDTFRHPSEGERKADFVADLAEALGGNYKAAELIANYLKPEVRAEKPE